MAYVTAADLKAYLSVSDTGLDAAVSDACESASALVDQWCGRSFAAPVGESARDYEPSPGGRLVPVDDAVTVTAVACDVDDDGTFSEVWSVGDWETWPANGVAAGSAGWPVTSITAATPAGFPVSGRRVRSVRVTGAWGWASAPATVERAALILAAEHFKLREAPFGVAGFGEYGVVRVRDMPVVGKLLAPFRKTTAMVG